MSSSSEDDMVKFASVAVEGEHILQQSKGKKPERSFAVKDKEFVCERGVRINDKVQRILEEALYVRIERGFEWSDDAPAGVCTLSYDTASEPQTKGGEGKQSAKGGEGKQSAKGGEGKQQGSRRPRMDAHAMGPKLFRTSRDVLRVTHGDVARGQGALISQPLHKIIKGTPMMHDEARVYATYNRKRLVDALENRAEAKKVDIEAVAVCGEDVIRQADNHKKRMRPYVGVLQVNRAKLRRLMRNHALHGTPIDTYEY